MQTDMEVQANVLGILNAYNYWDEITFPNWISFQQLPTPRNALNLAYSLWHLLDWIRLDKRHNFIGRSVSDIATHFVEECPALGIAHDIATFGKHAKVSRSRGAVESVEAAFVGAVLYFGPGGPRSEHPSTFTVTMSDGQQADLAAVFSEAMNFWKAYFDVPR
jgi:hypothetical protein